MLVRTPLRERSKREGSPATITQKNLDGAGTAGTNSSGTIEDLFNEMSSFGTGLPTEKLKCGFVRGLWNLKTLFVLCLVVFVICSNLPNIIIGGVYLNKQIEDSASRIMEMTSRQYVHSYASSELNHLIDVFNLVDLGIEEKFIEADVPIRNYSATRDIFRQIFMPHILVDGHLSALSFTYADGNWIGARRGNPNIESSHHEIGFTKFINGTRIMTSYRLNCSKFLCPDLLDVVFEVPYTIAWEFIDSKEFNWLLGISGALVESLNLFRDVHNADGTYAGKLGVHYYVGHISEVLRTLTDVTFMFRTNGDLFATSTFKEDTQIREKKIYKIHEYVNPIIQNAGQFLYDSHNRNYSTVQPTPNHLTFKVGNTPYYLRVERFGVDRFDGFVATVVNRDALFQGSKRTEAIVWTITCSIVVICILASISIGFSVSAPLSQFSKKLLSLSQLDLANKKFRNWLGLWELRNIARSLAVLRYGLLNFEKFLPTSIIQRMFRAKKEIGLHLTRTHASVFFIDIIGFTELTEMNHAKVVVKILTDFFDISEKCCTICNGFIDKFIGDAVMCIFTGEDHEKRCVECILMIFEKIQSRNETRDMRLPEINVRCGTGSGKCIGDTVNVAARLEPLNKTYGTDTCILTDKQIMEKTKEEFDFEFVDNIN